MKRKGDKLGGSIPQGKKLKAVEENDVVESVIPPSLPEVESNDERTEEAVVDPYLLEDSVICKSALTENRWTNKQRTLIFCARGVSHRHRHLMEDIKLMLPHSKSEAKWEKKGLLSDINEICEMQS